MKKLFDRLDILEKKEDERRSQDEVRLQIEEAMKKEVAA